MGHAAQGERNDHPQGTDVHALGPRLERALIEACEGRLSDVHWFRSDWQRGGAATAYGCYRCEHGPRDVVIKFPLSPREHRALTSLAEADAPTPRLAAHGVNIGPYDLAWVVMERLPGNPLAAHLHADVFQHLAEAVARFYHAAARRVKAEPPSRTHDWPALLDRARRQIRDNPSLTGASRWADAVKHAQRAAKRLIEQWDGRAVNDCCHGDLHPGNCMMRPETSPWGEPGPVLLDFAECHLGHWIEDAIYMERLYWARPDVLNGIKPVSMIAKARRALGLPTSDDYPALADIRRALMAATTPAFLEQEGHPAYLSAALQVLERSLTQLHI